MDSGAEEHVVSLADWKSLGGPVLKPAQVRLRSAIGDDMRDCWQFHGAWVVRSSNGGVDISGGDSSYKVSVFNDEAGECWLQQRD